MGSLEGWVPSSHMMMETEASSSTYELVEHLLKNYFKHYVPA